ncbi:MAG: hypothetical protein KIS86_04680 [Devosia sp.]|nr:hypothetical protein [Devosia sp.]
MATAVFVLLGVAAVQADARTDSLALLNVSIEASNKLAPAVENWDQVASKGMEAVLRSDVLEPLEAANSAWFDAGMKFGGGDDNPYRRYMACNQGADALRLQAIQLIHFHAGRWTADKVTFEHVEPAMAKLDECLTALKE